MRQSSRPWILVCVAALATTSASDSFLSRGLPTVRPGGGRVLRVLVTNYLVSNIDCLSYR